MTRLLLVDNDRLFADTFKALFSERGYEVDTLPNGDALWDLLRVQEFDLVILDNYLDGRSGVEILHLLNQIEEDTGWRKPPVVLLTGDSSVEMEVRARLAKTDFFLLKPCHFREIEELIEQVLHRRKVV